MTRFLLAAIVPLGLILHLGCGGSKPTETAAPRKSTEPALSAQHREKEQTGRGESVPENPQVPKIVVEELPADTAVLSPVSTVSVRPDGYAYPWIRASSADGKKAIVVDHSGDGLCLWDVPVEKRIAELHHAERYVAGAFSSDGRWVATGHEDKTRRIWQTANGQLYGGPLKHPHHIESITFSSDGKILLVAGRTGQLWDVSTLQAVGEPLINGNAPVHQIVTSAFSVDGRLMATGDNNGLCCRAPGGPARCLTGDSRLMVRS